MTSRRLRVLIVEDEGMIAMLLEDMVAELGHDVAAIAEDLPTGLAAARDLPIDLAILDVNLGGAMSYPIAETLASRRVPFLISSGYGVTIDHPAFANRPAIAKPFLMEDLVRAIDRAVPTPIDTNPIKHSG